MPADRSPLSPEEFAVRYANYLKLLEREAELQAEWDALEAERVANNLALARLNADYN